MADVGEKCRAATQRQWAPPKAGAYIPKQAMARHNPKSTKEPASMARGAPMFCFAYSSCLRVGGLELLQIGLGFLILRPDGHGHFKRGQALLALADFLPHRGQVEKRFILVGGL